MHTPEQAREQADKDLAEFLKSVPPMTPERARAILDARAKRKAERAAQEGGAV